MQGLIEQLNSLFGPIVTGKLGEALVGLAILIIGLIIVKFIAGIILRVLKRVSFLYNTNTDGTVTDYT